MLLGTYVLFLKKWIAHPRLTGAIFPSSKRLAKQMVSEVLLSKDEVVIELGAGTGIITQALVDQFDPSQIIVIEYSAEWVKLLRKKFPQIKIIEGNAANMTKLLGKDHPKVGSIISSLPLRSLPKNLTRTILNQITETLPKGRRYIQFTYHLKNDFKYIPSHYQQYHSHIVWLNLPPARVDVFTM